jgi:hypothetical protein
MNELVGVFEKKFGKRGKRIFENDKPSSVHSSVQSTPREASLHFFIYISRRQRENKSINCINCK